MIDSYTPRAISLIPRPPPQYWEGVRASEQVVKMCVCVCVCVCVRGVSTNSGV